MIGSSCLSSRTPGNALKAVCWLLVLSSLQIYLITAFAQQGQGLMQHRQIGSFQTNYGPFAYARRIALDAEGALIIADNINHRIVICDQEERCETFGVEGDRPGEFSFPEAVAVVPDGRIVVADLGNDRVQVCSREGECKAFRALEIANDEILPIIEPRGLAVDSDMQIWVVALFGIYRCSMEGQCALIELISSDTGEQIIYAGAWDIAIHDDQTIAIVRNWTGSDNMVLLCEPDLRCTGFGAGVTNVFPNHRDPGVFVNASGIGFDSQGRVIVADTHNGYDGRIQICTRAGQCRIATDEPLRPLGLALERDGNILVSGSRAGILRCNPNWSTCSILMGERAGAGHFDRPQGIAVLSEGEILVADSTNQVIKRCGLDGSCAFSNSLFKFDENGFARPAGVAAATDGSIAFSDSQQGFVYVCRPGWERCQHRRADGTGEFPFLRPRGLAFDSAGRLFIANLGGFEVLACEANQGDWECSGLRPEQPYHYWLPADVAIDGQGRLIVPDIRHHLIFICSPEGTCTSFGSQGKLLGQFDSPSAVAVNPDGRILIADTNNNRIQLCDYSGVCAAFGHHGHDKGQFFRPSGIDLDAQGRIVVSDTNNHRLLAFDSELRPIRINLGANGAWFNPESSGQGIFLDVLEAREQITFGWFTYENDTQITNSKAEFGDSGHRWLTSQGDLNVGGSLMSLYRSFGGIFNNPKTVTTQLVGEAVFELTSCWTGALSYEFRTDGDPTGHIPLVRISHDNVNLCEELDGVDALLIESDAHLRPPAIPEENLTRSLFNQGLSGAWFNPDTSGQGFFLDVLTQRREVALSWFTFDTSVFEGNSPSNIGDPGNRWITALGDFKDNKAVLTAYKTYGGKFDNPAEVTTEPYGIIELEFDNCSVGQVRYDFPEVSLAGAISIERISDANVEICELLSE